MMPREGTLAGLSCRPHSLRLVPSLSRSVICHRPTLCHPGPSRLVFVMRGGQSESVHFIPPPWETALVHSHRSRQQTPLQTSGAVWMHQSCPYVHEPQSRRHLSFVLPRLPGSPGTTLGAVSNTGTTGQDGREDAVQCLWGCACNKEKRSWNASLQKRGQRLGETVVSEIPP